MAETDLLALLDLTQVSLQIEPDHALEAVRITIATTGQRTVYLLGMEAALDACLRLTGAAVALRRRQHEGDPS